MSKILVLGGNGFIGQNLCKYLLDKKEEVFSFDIKRPDICVDGINYVVGDFFDDEILRSAIQNVDIVFHAISTINPGNSDIKYLYAYEHDFVQSVKLCSYLKEKNVKMVFLSSGGTVYGKQKSFPISEECKTNPINHYGAVKLCIENAIRTFNVGASNKMVIARISNPYGPGQDYTKGVGFVDAAIKKAIKGEELVVFGDGNVVRDYIYIDDVVSILYELMKCDGDFDVYNVSSGIGYSQKEIIEIIKKYYPNMKIRYVEGRNVDLKKVILDNDRIRTFCEFENTDMESGINQYISFLKNKIEKGENV